MPALEMAGRSPSFTVSAAPTGSEEVRTTANAQATEETARVIEVLSDVTLTSPCRNPRVG